MFVHILFLMKPHVAEHCPPTRYPYSPLFRNLNGCLPRGKAGEETLSYVQGNGLISRPYVEYQPVDDGSSVESRAASSLNSKGRRCDETKAGKIW